VRGNIGSRIAIQLDMFENQLRSRHVTRLTKVFCILFIQMYVCLNTFPCATNAQNMVKGQDPPIHEKYREVLERAYNLFLDSRTIPRNSPDQILFWRKRYNVVDFLGGEREAHVYRVENEHGDRSIFRVFRPETFFILGALEFYGARILGITLYRPINVDPVARIVQFQDIRGIPLDDLFIILKRMNAPEVLRSALHRIVLDNSRTFHHHNEILDIDTGNIVLIDLH